MIGNNLLSKSSPAIWGKVIPWLSGTSLERASFSFLKGIFASAAIL
jgi:hypothetical protein